MADRKFASKNELLNVWEMPRRNIRKYSSIDHSVYWNQGFTYYTQELFGSVSRIRYGHQGTMLGVVSSNQSALLRVPMSDGAVWNEQGGKAMHSIAFRDDDKLILEAADKKIIVRSSTTAFQRQFSGHTRDVTDAIFLGQTNFASCSEDTTVRLWDVVAQTELSVAKGFHTDYVKTLA